MTTLRSVVYGGGSLEHFLLEPESATLCARKPDHINPGSVTSLPTDDIVPGNYCRRCVQRARVILGRDSVSA